MSEVFVMPNLPREPVEPCEVASVGSEPVVAASLIQRPSRTLERSSLEFYAGTAIAVGIAMIPMKWWVMTGLLALLALGIMDVSFHSPWVKRWHWVSRLILTLISLSILGSLGWKTVFDQYISDHEAASAPVIRALGQSLVDLSSEVLAFNNERQKQLADILQNIKPSPDRTNVWQAGVSFRQETNALMSERFGGRILSDVAQLHQIGFDPPFQVRSAFITGESQSIGKWLAVTGRLLLDGNLKLARELAVDQKFWWNIID